MFSQQHYEALAKILRETRKELTSRARAAGSEKYDVLDSGKRLEIQHEAISQLQLNLMKMLKADNPKFKELLFIGLASEHSPDKPE